jgi:hypothetical protein
MVTGSVAAIFYGEPRLTHDVDFVVYLSEPDIDRLVQACPSDDYYLPPTEIIAAEARREQRGHFNIIHVESGFKADLYLTGRDELNAWGFRHTRQIQFEGEDLTLAPPEYVIVRKLEYYREGRSEKHLRDIRSILAVSGSEIDKLSLQEWISKIGLHAEWQLVSESQSPGNKGSGA